MEPDHQTRQNRTVSNQEFNQFNDAVKANIAACERLCGPLSNSDLNAVYLIVAKIQRKIQEAQ